MSDAGIIRSDFVKYNVLEADEGSAIATIEGGIDLTKKELESIVRREKRENIVAAAKSSLGSGNYYDYEIEPTRVADECGLIQNGKSDTMSLLESIALQANTDYEAFQTVEKQATVLMLRIGLMMEKAKAELPHGQFRKWAENNLTINYRHAHRFRKLAQFFIKSQELNDGEALALVDPTNSQAEIVDRMQQMAFDFLGDKNQAELFAMAGISVKEAKPLGGHHPSASKELKLDETHIRQLAKDLLYPLNTKILELMVDESTMQIQHMNLAELREFENTLVDALKNIRVIIKNG